MYQLDEIKHVHLEISSRCNASCPLCPRNFYGYEFNDGYVEHAMTITEAKKIFNVNFLRQLQEITINGNFGDAVMNPDTVKILEYFRQSSPDLKLGINTNAGARNKSFWQKLAKLKVEVIFCIDGLEDTHSIYRKNTLYSVVIKNAKTFISAGGFAVWKMIKFDHNKHQVNQAHKLSKEIGFKQFSLVDDGRNTGPIFDNNGNLIGTLGKPKETNFKILFHSRTTDTILLEDITVGRSPLPISCLVKEKKSLYISSTGNIYPCCYLGFNPLQYGHGNYHQAANAQLKPLIYKNNALEYGLDQCIEWFNNVENTWKIPNFTEGRLIICNDVCGKSNK